MRVNDWKERVAAISAVDPFKTYSGQILLSRSGPSANLTATVTALIDKHMERLGGRPIQFTIYQKL